MTFYQFSIHTHDAGVYVPSPEDGDDPEIIMRLTCYRASIFSKDYTKWRLQCGAEYIEAAKKLPLVGSQVIIKEPWRI